MAQAGPSTISGDGQVVAFQSTADNLVTGDTNDLTDVFVRDRSTGTTERVSVKSDGSQVTNADLPNAEGIAGYAPVLSTDGRYVVFNSYARLVAQDTDGGADVYTYDRQTDTLELISVSLTGGGSGLGVAVGPERYIAGADVSADGRYVVFESGSPSLVTNDVDPPANPAHPNGYWPDIFLRDRVSGTTQLISTVGSYSDFFPVITPDAAKIAYIGPVTVSGAVTQGIYVYDRASATTQLASLTSTGQPTKQAIEPAISADGTKVAFRAFGKVVPSLPNPEVGHLYLRDLTAGTTELVDVNSPGFTADREPRIPTLSADGRYVTFSCWCQRDNSSATPGMYHEGVYQRDRVLGVTEEVDVNDQGVVADHDSMANGQVHFASDDGAFVVFQSAGGNLIAADTNDHADVFVKRVR
jgi:Tol biopolymer transport system component